MTINIFLIFIVGTLFGVFLGMGLMFFLLKLIRPINESDEKKLDSDELMEKMKETFKNISQENLLNSQKTMLELTGTQWEEKTKSTNEKFETLTTAARELYKQASQLSEKMDESGKKVDSLNETTLKLNRVLSNNQRRGQWGEKMVKDILDFIGLKEGINYSAQKQMDDSRKIPDFTFNLPHGKQVNLDVKFPLDNYREYIAHEDKGIEKDNFKRLFLKDVRKHIDSLKGKDYISQGKTVDYVLMFIPNESIYIFINQEDESMIDEALKSKIVLCSPMTLYAVLSLIRQATESFHLEEKAVHLQTYVREFKKQWEKFGEKMTQMGKAIGSARKSFEELDGVRTKQLEKPMDKITDLSLGEGESRNSLESDSSVSENRSFFS